MLLDAFLEKREQNRQQDKEAHPQEHSLRSIAKAISWRTLGTIDTILISLALTGELVVACTIGSVEIVTKMVLYFLHERIWNNIKWGRQ